MRKERYNHISKEMIEKLYINENLSGKETSLQLGVDPTKLHYLLDKYKITKPKRLKITKELLVDLHYNQKKSQSEIGRFLGLTRHSIFNYFKKFDIHTIYYNSSPEISKDELYRLYIIEEKEANDIAKLFNVNPCVIKKRLKSYNINKRKIQASKFKYEELFELYIRQNKTSYEIAEILNSNPNSVIKTLKKYNISIRKACKRNYKDKIKTNCLNCGKELLRHPNYIKRIGRQYCSVECKNHWISNNLVGPNHLNFKGYISDYGKEWGSIKRKIRKRDKVCKMCGKNKSNSRNLDVHHIIPFRLFGAENHEKANNFLNLACYCNKCHKKAENLSRLIWDQEFFDKSKILETMPINSKELDCHSVYR